MTNKKHIIIAGFMLFSLFFGAGNLIFPPTLGMESGNAFIPAITGFILSAVFLPLITIITVSLSKNGLLSIGERVHPLFGMVFAVIVYLSIGAFYGIPRAANVAFELGFEQILPVQGHMPLFLFSLIFFCLTFVICLNPKKAIDLVGQWLTPALLIVLAFLFIKAFFTYSYGEAPTSFKFQDSPFLTGFIEGYYTMDAIAALAFGIVIINGFRSKGMSKRSELVKGTIGAGSIAAVGLILVYMSLGWIGRVIPADQAVANGAELLVLASGQLFGPSGNLIFGAIVILACLTTCVGLINACAQFFQERFTVLSYKAYVGVFTLIGLLFTNLGLNMILKIAGPLLSLIYPVAIVLVVLSLAQHFLGKSRRMFILSVGMTGAFSLYETFHSFNLVPKGLEQAVDWIPLSANGLEWTLPALLCAIIGFVWDHISGYRRTSEQWHG
ncbi:branched-chain amino acid transport system II carrier protein [Rossellomorea marisflavi]|uniref:branched-chain amino acid transport system II carrier protein n=1 Tax=Rossellomorea marisflavi TaxID=189381 RepID=UPI003D2F454E